MLRIQIFLLSILYRVLLGFQGLRRYSEIFIFDIDNTIANTWPSIGTTPINYQTLPYFQSVHRKVMECSQKKNCLLLYFSVRPLRSYLQTRAWLRKIGLPESVWRVFLFKSPQHKVQLVRWLCKKNRNIHYFDDMTFDHERGVVRRYESEIAELVKMELNYYGADFLLNLQKSKTIVK